ncbi:MAG TPA: protein kinase [Pyrinomonadaceae bacterium]|nr:protein kinase [Pyrinomonadaceae bacterium]
MRSLLGVGGMGEVYLAQDLQLRRSVALKLLPPQFTRDEERLRRFKQEAFAASSLNHPNLLTIFEIGQQGDTHFIATEYIDGRSLRQLITQDPVQLYQVLDWGTQIASALAAAHAAGIIHRDIKPDNIMVRHDGYVKVLDFGLAKLGEYRNLASDPEAATLQVIQTDPGKVMGTASYMSPEQTRGLQLDERTDIWSLGVILYELIAGRPPFEGLSTSDVVASILRTEPVPLQRFSPDVPDELHRIVRKALQKDPDERYHLAKEMAIDLRNLRRDLELNAEIERSVQPVGSADRSLGIQSRTHMNLSRPASDTAPVPQQRSTTSAEPFLKDRRRYSTVSKLVIGGIVLTLIAAAFVIINYWASGTRSVEPITNMQIARLTTTGRVDQAVISPDGKYIVHAAAENGLQSLRVRQVNTNSDVEVVPPSEVRYDKLIFSPDGDFVYYVATHRNSISSNLYAIPALGGSARKLISNVTSAVTLSPDGQNVAFIRNMADSGEDVVVVAEANGSNERKIAVRKLPNFFGSLTWSPSGNSLVCAAGSFVPAYNTYLIEIRLDDPKEKQLGSQTWASMGEIAWVPDSSGLVCTASDPDLPGLDSHQLWYVRYPEGEVRRITNDLNNYRGVSVTSDSKRLVTLQSASTCNLWVANNSNWNQPTQVTTGSRLDGHNGVAYMTGGQVVYSSSVGGNTDLWVMNADGSNQRQLTANSRNNTQPVITRDGRYLIFSSDRSGTANIWREDIDGTNPRQLTSGSGEAYPSCTPDGKWVVYTLLGAGKPSVWRVSIDGGAPEKIIEGYSTNPVVSPDGKSIACSYREQPNARMKIGLFSINGGEPIRTFDMGAMPVFDSASSTLRWTADGRALTYVLTAGDVSNLWHQPVSGEPAKQLTSFKSSRIFSFDWSPDGQQLILSRGTVTSDVILISNFR